MSLKKNDHVWLMAALSIALVAALTCAALPQSGVSQPAIPTTVYGFIYAGDGMTPVDGATVTGTNPRTEEHVQSVTGADGKYLLTFANYMNGDEVNISIFYQGHAQYREATLNNSSTPIQWLNVTMAGVGGDGDGEDDDGLIDDDHYLPIAIAAIMPVGLALLLFFLKRKKGDKEDESSDEGGSDAADAKNTEGNDRQSKRKSKRRDD